MLVPAKGALPRLVPARTLLPSVEGTVALKSAAYQVARKTRTGAPRLAAGWDWSPRTRPVPAASPPDGSVAGRPGDGVYPGCLFPQPLRQPAFQPVLSSPRFFIRLRTIRGRAALDRGPVRPGRGLRPAGLTRGVRVTRCRSSSTPACSSWRYSSAIADSVSPCPASDGIRYPAGSP